MFLTIYGVEKSQCDHSNYQDRDYDRNKQKIPIDLKIIFFTSQVQIQYNLISGIPCVVVIPDRRT